MKYGSKRSLPVMGEWELSYAPADLRCFICHSNRIVTRRRPDYTGAIFCRVMIAFSAY